MNIKAELLESDIYKISLSGRMDIVGVGEIEKEFVEMTAAPHMAVIIDMADVPYMSSIGIRALLVNGKTVMNRGGQFAIYNPQPNVQDVLKISGIDQILTVCSNLDEAMTAVKA